MIHLTLPMPPSNNRTSRAGVNRKSGRVYKPGAKLVEEYHEWVKMATITVGTYQKGMQGDLSVSIYWYYGKGPMMDIDNGVRTLLNALAANIGFNDRQIVTLKVYRWRDPAERPRAVVELRELEYGD